MRGSDRRLRAMGVRASMRAAPRRAAGPALVLLALAGCSSGDSAPPAGDSAVAAPRPVTVESTLAAMQGLDAYRLAVSRPAWTADSTAVWLTAPDPETGQSFAWKIDAQGGELQKIAPAVQVRPAPDGRVALVGADGELRIADANGGHGRRVATLEPVTIRWSEPALPPLAWSPDARRVAFVAPATQGGGGDAAGAPVEVHVLEVDSGERRRVTISTDGVWQVDAVRWMADGRRLVVAVEQPAEYRAQVRLVDIDAQPGNAGAIRTLVSSSTRYAGYLNPSPAPAGEAIAFASDPLRWITVQALNVALVNARDGAVDVLTGDQLWINFLGGFEWLPDSSAFYTPCKDGAFNDRLCRIGRDGSVSTVALDALQSIDYTWEQSEKWALSPDGESVAWIGADARGAMSLRAMRLGASESQLLMDLTPPMLRGHRLGTVEEITWTSFDGLRIAGILVFPVGYEKGERYPLVIDVHGGPQGGVPLAGSILLSSPLEWHLWANMGFALLVPDFRSSNVYGLHEFLALRETHELFDRDFRDIMAGVDAVIERGVADSDRLALLGHSYGGAQSNWALTQTDRFRLVIPKEGALAVDLARTYRFIESSAGSEGELFTAMYDWLFGGSPAAVPEIYARQSPITHVAQARSAVIVVAGGESDGRGEADSMGESWATALRPHAADVVYLEYPGEGHVFTREETHRDLLTRVARQLERHLQQGSRR